MPKKNLVLRVKDAALKRRLIAGLVSGYSYWLGGFFTEELRSGAAREGFVLRTLSGASEVMASKTVFSHVAFNKYGVNLHALDVLAADSLADVRRNGKIALMDELGPITLASEKLAAAVTGMLASDAPCIATFRGNAAVFEATFAGMTDTTVLDTEASRSAELRDGVNAWMEFWIDRLKDKGL